MYPLWRAFSKGSVFSVIKDVGLVWTNGLYYRIKIQKVSVLNENRVVWTEAAGQYLHACGFNPQLEDLEVKF